MRKIQSTKYDLFQTLVLSFVDCYNHVINSSHRYFSVDDIIKSTGSEYSKLLLLRSFSILSNLGYFRNIEMLHSDIDEIMDRFDYQNQAFMFSAYGMDAIEKGKLHFSPEFMSSSTLFQAYRILILWTSDIYDFDADIDEDGIIKFQKKYSISKPEFENFSAKFLSYKSKGRYRLQPEIIGFSQFARTFVHLYSR